MDSLEAKSAAPKGLSPLATTSPKDPSQLLNLFYAPQGLSLPPLQSIYGPDVPQPFRQLLVHEKDMTPTLEEFHGRRIRLEVLARRQEGNEYCRQVVLRLEGTNVAVEFGANRVLLDRYSPAARAAILAEKEPLGHIMRDCRVLHVCRPSAYLRVATDSRINHALGLSGAQVLYGRHNRLFDLDGRLISEVVEILAPVPTSTPSRPTSS